MTTKLEAMPEGIPNMISNEKARDAERRIVDEKGGMKFTCICNSSYHYQDEVSIIYR